MHAPIGNSLSGAGQIGSAAPVVRTVATGWFEDPEAVVADAPNLLTIADLTVAFAQGTRWVRVLHGLHLAIAPGQTLGMVGESGCGKSVTWLAVLRLLGPKAAVGGMIALAGQPIVDATDNEMARIRGGRMAMIFQDPMSALNPVHSIGRQIAEVLITHRGFSAGAARLEAARLLDLVEIPETANALAKYPHELSGGMNQRAMIAMALAGEPERLVCDEPVSALDVSIQAQVINLLHDLRDRLGLSYLFISHDLKVVRQICDEVAVMYLGRIVEHGPAEDLLRNPAHPYTQALVSAVPTRSG